MIYQNLKLKESYFFGGCPTSIFIPQKVAHRLREYTRHKCKSPSDRIFPISYEAARIMVLKSGNIVGIHLRPHDLHRIAATYASRDVRKWMVNIYHYKYLDIAVIGIQKINVPLSTQVRLWAGDKNRWPKNSNRWIMHLWLKLAITYIYLPDSL